MVTSGRPGFNPRRGRRIKLSKDAVIPLFKIQKYTNLTTCSLTLLYVKIKDDSEFKFFLLFQFCTLAHFYSQVFSYNFICFIL